MATAGDIWGAVLFYEEAIQKTQNRYLGKREIMEQVIVSFIKERSI